MRLIKPVETYKRASSILKRMNVPFWVAAGTALGLYRDGNFISHDTDIDIEIIGYPEGLIGAFEKEGFQICRIWRHNNNYMQTAFYDIENGRNIFDIYYYYKEGEDLVNHNDHGKMIIPGRFTNSIEMLLYMGEEFPFLKPVEDYLEVRYKNWRKPEPRKGDWSKDAGNLYKE